jgi:DNA-binding MarR family transcriptional regulator
VSSRAVLAVIRASRDPDRFTHAEFRVMVNLAEHHNSRTGRCDPGLRLLEEETGLPRGQLMRCINRLEDRGELARPGTSKGGRGHRRPYVILLKGSLGVTLWSAERVPALHHFTEGADGADGA